MPIAQADAPGGRLTAELPDPEQEAGSAVAAPLPDAETQQLLARLPPLPAAAGPAPSIRPPSPPPPRAGAVQPIAFAVPTGKPVADAPIAPVPRTAPLPPPQISPEGEVAAESEVRIRFSEAMVPVAQVGTVARPPAAIAPAVAGTWRWIDTRVLSFTAAAPRFPGATAYTVTVPAGARAVNGATLLEPASASFATAPVQITGVYPPTPVRPDAPLAVGFDQRVDPARIAALLAVLGPRDAALPARAISLAEAEPLWRRNPGLAYDPDKLARQLGPHHVILAPRTAWPAGIRGRVALRPGAPSLEGPRVSARESSLPFAVVAPFTVRGVSCEPRYEPRMAGNTCHAHGWASVELSNPIERASFRAELVQVEGQPFTDRRANHSSVRIEVPDLPGRTAAVAIRDGLVDVHGQPLVGPRRPTFAIGAARIDPYLEAPTGLHVLDPRFEIPQWVLHTEAVASVRVELYRVQPEDYFAFAAFERGERRAPPGRRVLDRTHAVGVGHGAHVRVDLRPALGAAGLGHLVAIATAAAPRARSTQRRTAWIQVTRLGVSARTDRERVHAWVQDVAPSSFLAPRAGAVASIVLEGRPGAGPAPAPTDAQGHAAFELPPPAAQPWKLDREPIALLVARTADDATFQALDGPHARAVRHHDAYWYATDDRFTYRPGETVHVKGWVRWTHDGVNPDLSLPAAGEAVAYTLADARGNQLASGRAPLSDRGGFDLSVPLPPNANLGLAQLTFSTRSATHSHTISIQEFRTPAFAVALTDDVAHGGALPLVLGEAIEMSAAASYYAGGGLPGAPIEWTARLARASYEPPGWDRFVFDPIRARGDDERWRYRHRDDVRLTLSTPGALSGASAASIVYGVAALPDGRPATLTVDALVIDVDRARIRATSRPILVHPSSYYVGLRLRPGDPRVLEAIATDLDGNAVRGVPIEIEIEAVLGSERDRDDARVTGTQRCALTSEAAPVACPFRRTDEHAYTAIARIADPRGRANAAYFPIPWYARDDRRSLAVIPDRAEYRPGDVAKLEIRSDVVPATAIVSFARQGVIAQRRIELAQPSTIVELPIEPSHLRNVHVVVDRLAKRTDVHPGSALPLPEDDEVSVDLPVSLEGARLAMRARPTRPHVEPGAPATFEVEVRHGGKPVDGAEVALIVVDEGVLAVSRRTHEDPLARFHHTVDEGTWKTSSLSLVQDAAEDLDGAPGIERYSLATAGRGRMGHGSGSGSASAPTVRIGAAGMGGGGSVKVRKDFRPDAAFSPRLRTGPDGKVSLTVDMPESLTRFRVIALASAGTHQFGKAEGTIVTRRKINARTVAPRFLTQGDAFALPIVVQNLDARPRTVDVAVRAANLAAAGPAGRRVTIPAGQRAEVRFPLATRARGRAVIQTIVASEGAADASSVELPVYEPATTEAFATYGTVDGEARFEQLAVPADVFPDVGGVEVELASTQLQSLTDAYWYLYRYPYECAEQRSSRMIATAALHDLLEAFAAPGRPTRAQIEATIADDVRRLAEDQHVDGGWGYFERTRSDPFVTLQVLAALTAHRAGDTAARRHAIAFAEREVASLLAGLASAAAAPAGRRPAAGELAYRVGLAAFALAVLGGTGADVRPRAERLHALATELAAYPIDARARLLAIVAKLPRARAMRARLLGDLVSATRETASAATVTVRFEEAERLLLVSNAKTTALVLDALLREAPDHALVTKLVRGVLDARRGGRWASTQENLVALTALRRYFDTHEKATPAFTGRVWIGAAAYAEQAFAGRSGARGQARLGWTQLAPGSTHDVAIARAGEGRMYYRIGITYAPKRSDLPALDAGFIVRRAYTAIDDPADVTRTPDGRWKIRLGARVQVTLEAINTTARHAVALVDPLPAGLEAVNERLATSERAVRGPGGAAWDHVAMRDNRTEVFAMSLAPGGHQFSYTVRASTPGTFLAAPARAEEMYSPETFGRSVGATVVIE